MTTHDARGQLVGKGMAVFLLLAVAAFCGGGDATMGAAGMGCDSHYDSEEVCGQSGSFAPLHGVIPDTSPVQLAGSPAAWLAPRPPPVPILQFQAGPSSPRAPPLLIL